VTVRTSRSEQTLDVVQSKLEYTESPGGTTRARGIANTLEVTMGRLLIEAATDSGSLVAAAGLALLGTVFYGIFRN
jgi:hypothetical protein